MVLFWDLQLFQNEMGDDKIPIFLTFNQFNHKNTIWLCYKEVENDAASCYIILNSYKIRLYLSAIVVNQRRKKLFSVPTVARMAFWFKDKVTRIESSAHKAPFVYF